MGAIGVPAGMGRPGRVATWQGAKERKEMVRGKYWILLFGLALMAGCSEGETAWVSGKVTLAGKDVPTGALRFFPTGGTLGNGCGAEIVDGHYEITSEIAEKKGMLAGKYRVSVVAIRTTGRKIRNPDGAGMVNQTQMYIPPRYNRLTRLLTELKPGENDYDLTMKP